MKLRLSVAGVIFCLARLVEWLCYAEPKSYNQLDWYRGSLLPLVVAMCCFYFVPRSTKTTLDRLSILAMVPVSSILVSVTMARIEHYRVLSIECSWNLVVMAVCIASLILVDLRLQKDTCSTSTL